MKNKKRMLLLGVGAMSAMALAVGATSTFAWFQATVEGRVKTNTDGKGVITVDKPTIGLDAVDLPVEVAITNDLSTNDLALATWLTAAPTGANSIKSGEAAFSSAKLYTAVAKGSTAASGFMYTANPGSGFVLSTVYTLTITVPANHLKPDGTEGGSAYAYKNGNELYTHDEIVSALSTRYIDLKLERNNGYTKTVDTAIDGGKTYYTESDGVYSSVASPVVGDIGTYYEAVSSRAKFFSFGTDTTPDAKVGLESINTKTEDTDGYLSSGYSLSAIGTGVALYFGLYVEGENGGTLDQMKPIGDFKVTIVDHANNFPG